MKTWLKQLYVHLPATQLEKRLCLFAANGWNPEIALQTSDLDQGLDCPAIRHQLREAELSCCIHAPFFDLNPASSDLDIVAITRRRFEQTLRVAVEIEASHIVFHPGYDPWRYARNPQSWLENSLRFWPDLIHQASERGLFLCLENIFDSEPRPLLELLTEIDSPYLRHCFDIGHWFLFSQTPVAEWLRLFAPYLHHLHLHDNRGRKDDHRPIGRGKIDFNAFFQQLLKQGLQVTATLEAHCHKDVVTSFSALQKLL